MCSIKYAICNVLTPVMLIILYITNDVCITVHLYVCVCVLASTNQPTARRISDPIVHYQYECTPIAIVHSVSV